MDKLRFKVYKELLKDISAYFDGAEKLIEEKMEEIYSWEKIFVEELIYLFLLLCFINDVKIWG